MNQTIKILISLSVGILMAACTGLNPESSGSPGVLTTKNQACQIQELIHSLPPIAISDLSGVCSSIIDANNDLSSSLGRKAFECRIEISNSAEQGRYPTINELELAFAGRIGAVRARAMVEEANIREFTHRSEPGVRGFSVFLYQENSLDINVIWTMSKLWSVIPKSLTDLYQLHWRLDLQSTILAEGVCSSEAFYEIKPDKVGIYGMDFCDGEGVSRKGDVYFSNDGRIILTDTFVKKPITSCGDSI